MNTFDKLFTLRIKTREGMIVINAYDANNVGSYGHSRVDIEVKQNGKVIFKRGDLYVGIPSGHSIDDGYVKEAVLSCVAMKPGDTDREYFDSYSQEQLDWANQYGEDLDMIRMDRYCDRDGNLKTSLR